MRAIDRIERAPRERRRRSLDPPRRKPRAGKKKKWQTSAKTAKNCAEKSPRKFFPPIRHSRALIGRSPR
jgi:hypothetical protein